mgnify:FL=1
MTRLDAFIMQKELAYYLAVPSSTIRTACSTLEIAGPGGRFTLPEAVKITEHLKATKAYAPYFVSRSARMSLKTPWHKFILNNTRTYNYGWFLPLSTIASNDGTDVAQEQARALQDELMHTFHMTRSTGMQVLSDAKLKAIALEPYGMKPKDMQGVLEFYEAYSTEDDSAVKQAATCKFCGHFIPYADRLCIHCMLKTILPV